jgi:hypothetical protein
MDDGRRGLGGPDGRYRVVRPGNNGVRSPRSQIPCLYDQCHRRGNEFDTLEIAKSAEIAIYNGFGMHEKKKRGMTMECFDK